MIKFKDILNEKVEGKLTKSINEAWITDKSNEAEVYLYATKFEKWCKETSEDALDVAGNYKDQDESKKAKQWIAFSKVLDKMAKSLKATASRFESRSERLQGKRPILPPKLHDKMENSTFHMQPTTEDNWKWILKQSSNLAALLGKLK